MKMDTTASAYGLLQIVFANMTYELARALFGLRAHRDPQFKFEDVPWQFGKILKELKAELDLMEADSDEKDSVAELRRLCRIAAEPAPWRHSRTHARVVQVEDGLALFDWTTGKRLSISAAECEEKIQLAFQVVCNVPAHSAYLLRELDTKQAIDEFFQKLSDEEIRELSLWTKRR